MKKKIIYSILVVLLVIIVVAGSTFAYFSGAVTSNNSNLATSSQNFSVIYNGDDAYTGAISLVTDKSDGYIAELEFGISENVPGITGDILFNVTNISNNLKIAGFKWESYIVNNDESESLQKSGNFANAANGSVISMADNIPLSTTLKNIKIYIWIDVNDPSVGNDIANGTASFAGYISSRTNRLTGVLSATTLTLDADDGTIPTTTGWIISGDTATKQIYYGSSYGELPTPTKSGYTFGGWYLDTGFTQPVVSNTIVSSTSNHSLYAKWQANS